MSLAAQAGVLRVLQDNVITRMAARGQSRGCAGDHRRQQEPRSRDAARKSSAKICRKAQRRAHSCPAPLREHPDDAPLVSYFIAVLTEREGITPRRMGEGALERLKSFDWPGNVRELRNTVERLLILARAPRSPPATSSGLRARCRRHTMPGNLTQCRTFRKSSKGRGAHIYSASSASSTGMFPRQRERWKCRALKPVQEDRAVRSDARALVTSHSYNETIQQFHLRRMVSS